MMKQKKLSKSAAKATANVLDTLLRADANSASCVVFYQPKAPVKLERFRREK